MKTTDTHAIPVSAPQRPRTDVVPNRILCTSVASLLAMLVIAGSESPATAAAPAKFWLGGTDGTWTGPNWASDATGTPTTAIPMAADDITFSAAAAQHQTTTLGQHFTIRSLTISDPMPVTINSGTGGPFKLTLSGNAGTGLNVQAGASLVTIVANVTLGLSAYTTTVNNTAGVVFNGALTATNSMSKEGTGTLTLAGPGIFQSPSSQPAYTLRVAGGTLVVDNDGVTTHGTFGSRLTDVQGTTSTSAAPSEGGSLKFVHLASAGSGIITTHGLSLFIVSDGGGSGSTGPGTTSFYDHSTAGSATFYAGAGAGGALPGGSVNFYDSATAANGTFLTFGGSQGGSVNFHGNSTAGRASITATWGTGGGGTTVFNDASSAQNATIIAEGGTSSFNTGGVTQFNDTSHAGSATLITSGGTNGGSGGSVYFTGSSTGDTAGVQLSGNAKLDISGHAAPGVSIGSLAGSGGNVFLGASNLDIGGNNTSTTFSGVMKDGGFGGGTGGSISKSGTGMLNLTGTNTYTRGTTLNAGTLAAGSAKAFGSGNLTMTGGTLETTGGPLSVDIGAGNIRFGGGTFLATVGGTTPGVTHDQLRTAGTANISGGKLALVQLNNFHLSLGEMVVLLSATGGVAGGSANGTAIPGSNVTGLAAFGNAPMLDPVVNLYTDSVVLELVQGSFAAMAHRRVFTPIQRVVAGALDSLGQTGTKTINFKEFNYLDSLPLSLLPANLDLLSPAPLTSIFQVSTSLANIQTANIQQRLADIRGPDAAGGFGGGGAQGSKGARGDAIAPADDWRWGTFVNGSGEFTHVGGTMNASGFNLDSGGVTAGVDYRFTDKFAAGISIGYMNTTARLASGGKVDVDGGRVGAYATWFDGGLHLDAAVSGGPNGYATRRTTPANTTATAGPRGAEINALLAGGCDWKWKGLTVGPTAAFQYTGSRLDGFTERGAFAPLRVASQNGESLRSALGFQAAFDAKVGSAIIRPAARAAWQHEFGDTAHSLTSSFATLGGSAFTVSGPSTGRDSLLVGAGYSIMWNERFSTAIFYDGELLRTNYSSSNVSAGFGYRF